MAGTKKKLSSPKTAERVQRELQSSLRDLSLDSSSRGLQTPEGVESPDHEPADRHASSSPEPSTIVAPDQTQVPDFGIDEGLAHLNNTFKEWYNKRKTSYLAKEQLMKEAQMAGFEQHSTGTESNAGRSSGERKSDDNAAAQEDISQQQPVGDVSREDVKQPTGNSGSSSVPEEASESS